MATVTITGRQLPLGTQVTGAKKRTPIKIWATVGAISYAVEALIIGRWLLSDPVRTPTGPTPVPGWMRLAGDIWVTFGLVCLALTVYFFIFRPWRRTRQLSFDGMLALACGLVYWQDPLSNWFRPFFLYNSMFLNRGAWVEAIPGWFSPNGGKLAEPWLFSAPLYVTMIFLLGVLGCWVMRRAKERWPQIGPFGLYMCAFAVIALFDLVLEPMWLRLGFYAYGGVIPQLTLFHGHYYQFPILEAVFFPMLMAFISVLRYHKNDRGESLAERGLDSLKVNKRGKTLIRFLAVSGAINAIIFTYNLIIPFNFYQAEWPKDLTKRSYLMNGICGPGTEYACPGHDVPMPWKDRSFYMTPEGEFKHP